MAEGDGITLPKGWVGIAVGIIILFSGVYLLSGMKSTIDDLSAKTAVLEQDVEQLEELSLEITAIQLQVEETRRELEELSGIRDEIAQAICVALDQDPCPGL